jgi:hypothetical protein
MNGGGWAEEEASRYVRAGPLPDPSPLVPRGEGRIRVREPASDCVRRGAPTRSSPRDLPQCWGRLGVAEGSRLGENIGLASAEPPPPDPLLRCRGRGGEFDRVPAVVVPFSLPAHCPPRTARGGLGRGPPRLAAHFVVALGTRGYSPRRRTLRCSRGEFIRSWEGRHGRAARDSTPPRTNPRLRGCGGGDSPVWGWRLRSAARRRPRTFVPSYLRTFVPSPAAYRLPRRRKVLTLVKNSVGSSSQGKWPAPSITCSSPLGSASA